MAGVDRAAWEAGGDDDAGGEGCVTAMVCREKTVSLTPTSSEAGGRWRQAASRTTRTGRVGVLPVGLDALQAALKVHARGGAGVDVAVCKGRDGGRPRDVALQRGGQRAARLGRHAGARGRARGGVGIPEDAAVEGVPEIIWLLASAQRRTFHKRHRGPGGGRTQKPGLVALAALRVRAALQARQAGPQLAPRGVGVGVELPVGADNVARARVGRVGVRGVQPGRVDARRRTGRVGRHLEGGRGHGEQQRQQEAAASRGHDGGWFFFLPG
ncbi:hypothetical protein MBR_06147, partial [Metarhizium brunneum ARSEF 3297]